MVHLKWLHDLIKFHKNAASMFYAALHFLNKLEAELPLQVREDTATHENECISKVAGVAFESSFFLLMPKNTGDQVRR